MAPDDPHLLAVLRYRKVGPPTEEDWLTTTAVPTATFQEQMATLHRSDWDAIGEERLLEGLRDPDALPERAALITFDGAYAHLVDRVVPVLRRYRIPAVAFVAAARIGKRFSYEPEADRPEAVCDWDGLRALEDAEVAIGCLGLDHRPLTDLSAEDTEREIVVSKALLERGLGTPVRLFAYPTGDPGADPEASARIVRRAGYRAAFGTGEGDGPAPVDDPWRIGRITVGPTTDLAAALDLDRT